MYRVTFNATKAQEDFLKEQQGRGMNLAWLMRKALSNYIQLIEGQERAAASLKSKRDSN